ncbi:phage tail protein, partial [Actinobacillus seminis]|uniref:phage tail protein n=1 Tax=Actinobacillus seminis TaxID=722 RepID=UPI003B9246D4
AQTAADKAQRTAEVKAPVANPIFTTDKTYMDMDTIPSGTLFFRINERAANQPDNTYGYFDAQAWQFDVGDQKTQFIIYNDSDMKVRYKDDGQRWTSWNTMLTSKNLSDAVTNSARDIPASVGGVKIAYDRAVEAEKKGLPTGAVLGFAKGVTPTGFLKCDGTIFNRHTYPDLYRTLGNSNKLPDLTRSDVGMLAYFPHDNIPAGWLPCDGKSVTQAQYPELYRYLGNKYGANGKLPDAGDRFIRNAGAGLAVGTLQNDAIKTHEIQVPDSSTLGRNAGVFHYAERGGAHNSEYNILTYKGEEETRPKAIAFKLCIKAKNTFDDVIFWIKAFGEVQNAGVLDAGRIAQDLQDKADRRHTHTTGDITNFSHEVTALLKPVRKDYNRTVTLTKKLFDDIDDDWELEQRNINVTGNVTSYSDGCIEQFFHYKNFRMNWFDMEERGKGDHMGYIIPCQLWTAMPKKVTKVHVQFIRRVADTANAISYRDEAGEWQYAWAYYKQDGNKSKIWINASRIKGGSDEHMDMLIWVEGY